MAKNSLEKREVEGSLRAELDGTVSEATDKPMTWDEINALAPGTKGVVAKVKTKNGLEI